MTDCEKQDAGDGWHRCGPCGMLWFGAPHRCYNPPPQVYRPGWRLILLGFVSWAVVCGVLYGAYRLLETIIGAIAS
jgi:hypothetical protein